MKIQDYVYAASDDIDNLGDEIIDEFSVAKFSDVNEENIPKIPDRDLIIEIGIRQKNKLTPKQIANRKNALKKFQALNDEQAAITKKFSDAPLLDLGDSTKYPEALLDKRDEIYDKLEKAGVFKKEQELRENDLLNKLLEEQKRRKAEGIQIKISPATQKLEDVSREMRDYNRKYGPNTGVKKDEIIPDVSLTKRQIQDRLADFDIEVATINKELGKIGPNFEDAAKLGKQEEFTELVQRKINIGNERDSLTKQLATAPTGKIAERLRENLKNVAASDAKALRETQEVLEDASKATGRKILPGTPHPTDAKKVRGYDGRWVTQKHFDQVTESKKGANEIRAQFDQPVQEVAELSQAKTIDLRLLNEGKIDTYIDGPVYIDRIERDIDGQWVTSSGLRGDYDLTIKNPEDLRKNRIKRIWIYKKRIFKIIYSKENKSFEKKF